MRFERIVGLFTTLTAKPLSKLKRILRDPQNVQALALWSAAAVTGLIAVEYARTFKFLERQIMAINDLNPYYIFAVSPICLIAGWWVIRRFAPLAGGSGIPQIMAANEMDYRQNQAAVDGLLSLRVAAAKVVSSLLAIAGGAAIGREGPTLHISACIFHFFGRHVRRLHPSADSHTWIIAGSAAGLASAFNTPLGGIVYAIEEMGSLHFSKVKTSVFTSVIIAGLVSQWLLGPYLYLGYPALTSISAKFLPYALLTGILSGALGAAFGRGLTKAIGWKNKIKGLRGHLTLALGCGLLLGGLVWLSRFAAGSGSEIMNLLLFREQKADSALVVYRFLATGISYMSGAAGGIFSPSLATGASFGSLLDQVLSTGHPHLMVLLGMIGFLTGVTRTPFTSFILVLEMTDRHSAIFPMMICALVANGAALLVAKHGFYEEAKLRFLATGTSTENAGAKILK